MLGRTGLRNKGWCSYSLIFSFTFYVRSTAMCTVCCAVECKGIPISNVNCILKYYSPTILRNPWFFYDTMNCIWFLGHTSRIPVNHLTLSLLMSCIYGTPSKARNLTSYIYGRDFLLVILLLEPCISLIYA
jgi:hypothetical protein